MYIFNILWTDFSTYFIWFLLLFYIEPFSFWRGSGIFATDGEWFSFQETDCGFINRWEREQKRPPDGGLFDLSGERLTGWRSREQLKTHPQKNAADYGKVCRKASNGSINNFNVFFCFNIILTFATWFLRYFSAALRLNICKAQVFYMFYGANIFTFILGNFFIVVLRVR